MEALTTAPEGAASLVDVDEVALRVDARAVRVAAVVASPGRDVVEEAVHAAVAPPRRPTPKQAFPLPGRQRITVLVGIPQAVSHKLAVLWAGGRR